MLVTQKRPRVLDWFHAGPLLFGDWGTSRLYVLGLAFAATGSASPYYLIGLSVLMVAVAWAYTLICSQFHDGGGVYTAARQISPLLSVIGATLLMADYIVTAALSLVDSFHYFGVPEGPGGWWIFMCCVGALAIIGGVNWLGAKNAGRFALYIAGLTMILSAVIAVAVLPMVPKGISSMHWGQTPPLTRWTHFAAIILALSGVEAVANMTGIMKEPVARTSKRTIWPILGEVATLNILFSVSLIGIVALGRSGLVNLHFSEEEIKNSAMKVLAVEAGQHWLGEAAGLYLGKAAAMIFGLLLVSAANTVVVDMIGVLYSLGRDRELPHVLTKLNYSGVPRLPLFLACSAPALVLLISRDLEQLSHLYAIGVCGAITLNVFCCAINRKLSMTSRARAGMFAIAVVVGSIWLTIAITKPQATLFAGTLVAAVLTFRFVAGRFPAKAPGLPEPALGWLAEIQAKGLELDSSRPRIMLAARGRFQAEFGVDMALRRKATLFVIYVRTLRVLEMGEGDVPKIEDDREAQESLGTAVVLARRYGVPIVPIYVCSADIAEEILDYTVTFGCDTLIMGKTKRRAFARAVEGDVITRVAQHLPSEVALITRDDSPHALPEPERIDLGNDGGGPHRPTEHTDTPAAPHGV